MAQKIKEFRSFYGEEFSEKILCYQVIESIYNDKSVRFSGKTLSDMQIDGAPDFYIRKGTNIILLSRKTF